MAKMFELAPLGASEDAWDGLAGALIAEDYFGAAPAITTGLVKVFTAAGWEEHAVKVWTGSVWQELPVRRWTGNSWT